MERGVGCYWRFLVVEEWVSISIFLFFKLGFCYGKLGVEMGFCKFVWIYFDVVFNDFILLRIKIVGINVKLDGIVDE